MKRKLLLSTLTLSLFLVFTPNVNAQQNIYVKTSAAGTSDGSSWENATTLTDALGMTLNDGDMIHIAEGTYVPTNNVSVTPAEDDGLYKTFEISKNIHLIAGYPAAITDETIDASPESYTTTLSGDINGDGSVRMRRVVTIGAPIVSGQSVIFKGLTIQDGYANYVGSLEINGVNIFDSFGGGLAIHASNVEMNQCTIRHNGGRSRGSISAHESVLVMNNCNIIDNNEDTTNTGFGRGLYVVNSIATLNECNLSGNVNYAGQSGALYSEGSTVNLYNSTVANNQSGTYSAGVYLHLGSTGNFVNCTFYGNKVTTANDYYPASILARSNNGVSTAYIISSTFTGGEANYEVAWYTNTTVLNLYNSIISGTNTTGTVRPGAIETNNKMILGADVLDASGSTISSDFDASTMLGTFDGNICALTGTNNPAITNGMSLAELTTVCDALNIPSEIYSMDQANVSRSGKISIGAVVLDGTLSIDKNGFAAGLKLYPNPTTDRKITLDLGHNFTYENLTITVFDITGRTLKSLNQIKKQSNKYDLDLNFVSKNQFVMIHINNGQNSATFKVLVK
ncbi:T9SS type A sorting domain-containing protein [Aestuariibaculum sediminum]|uniref:T9SS type A sorting domain-containing protein n=1 Tax=Aestuariibaculum sediminum TaxID=2770637 RepID=A0A8J6Q9J6_9FLAO|nr:T9SS type A sorting domain-containing protein [Aestuariibaculum sediminum]MBD0833660.1 T9SS type A sorting domain-containing protein [Aestuariibaculum sediminum]